MTRYVNTEDVIYELERAFPVDDYEKIIRCIRRTPTADVVEVVRCKDCIYAPYKKACNLPYGINGYCPLGERREIE